MRRKAHPAGTAESAEKNINQKQKRRLREVFKHDVDVSIIYICDFGGLGGK
jgi:hypothetical protein